MKFANLFLASALIVGSAVAVAVAQPAAPPAGGGGGGGGRGALQAACAADIQANCSTAGRGMRQCLTDNKAKLSAGCAAAVAALPPAGAGGGGGAAP